MQTHHHTVIDDGLQTEQSSLVDVDQIEVLAGLAVPEQRFGSQRTFHRYFFGNVPEQGGTWKRAFHRYFISDVPEQLRTIVSWWKRAGHFFCLSFPPHRSVLNLLLRVEVWHPGLEKSGEPLKLILDRVLPMDDSICTLLLSTSR